MKETKNKNIILIALSICLVIIMFIVYFSSSNVSKGTYGASIIEDTGAGEFGGGGGGVSQSTYTIEYNANGGSGAPLSQTKNADVDLTLSSTKPTREGYTFKGWATSDDKTTVAYSAGDTYTKNVGARLYAVWEGNSYGIKYKAKESDVTGMPSNETYTYEEGGTVKLSSTEPTRTGYTFLGWSEQQAAESVNYTAGAEIDMQPLFIYLYAVWKTNTYTITYNANNGSEGPGTVNHEIATNGKVTLSSSVPTKTGYTFKGWSKVLVGVDDAIDETLAIYKASSTLTPDATETQITLYAVWTANKYTITYDANGGSDAPSEKTYTYASSGTVTLSSTKPKRTGYTFKGWATSASAPSATYEASAKFNKNVASDTTLYAVWEEDEATASSSSSSSSNSSSSSSSSSNSSSSSSSSLNTSFDSSDPSSSSSVSFSSVSSSSSNNSNATSNPKTGTISIFIVWIMALGTIAYAFYYFKQSSI